MKLKHILVPMDFSQCSMRALEEAATIAKQLNSKLFLIHSAQITAPYVNMGEPFIDTFPTNYMEEIESSFEGLEKDLPILKEVDFETKEVTINFSDAIYTEITTNQIDLVIMGTKEHHDAVENMLGTHASDMLKVSTVPVLIIPGSEEKKSINRIGIAVDARSIKEVDKLDVIYYLAQVYGADIDIFYVAKEGESLDFNNSSYNDIFQSYFKGISFSFHNVKSEKVIEGLKNYVIDSGIDLLVMFPRHHELMERLLYGSNTQKVIKKIQIPVLAIPE